MNGSRRPGRTERGEERRKGQQVLLTSCIVI